MARSQSEGVNAYADALNPFADWAWGSYFHEAGQFGVGEGKGFVNFAAGTVVYSSPALMLLDEQTGGRLGSPLAASNESQADGAGTAEGIAFVGSFFTGGGEAAAVEGGAAKILAGAESRAAASGGIAIATEGAAQAGSGASSSLLESIRAAGGTLAVPRGAVKATDLADLTTATGNEFVLYRDRATRQIFVRELGSIGGNFPENSRLVIHSQPGEGIGATRPSPKDYVALQRAEQHSSLIIDAGKSYVRRFSRSSEHTGNFGNLYPVP